MVLPDFTNTTAKNLYTENFNDLKKAVDKFITIENDENFYMCMEQIKNIKDILTLIRQDKSLNFEIKKLCAERNMHVQKNKEYDEICIAINKPDVFI
jgi:hypothetical protein